MANPLLNFVHISDTHIHPSEDYIKDYADYTPLVGARALVKALKGLPHPPDVVLHTGDVAYDPDPEAYQTVKAVLSEIQTPILYLGGNHDDQDALQRIVMERDEPQKPLHFDVEINGVQIVGVDSNGPAEMPAGSVIPEQLDWLDSICSAAADDRPLVIATHHNPIQVAIPWLDDYMAMANSDDFHRVVVKAKARLRGVFFGHIHQNVHVQRDGVLYSAAASSWCQLDAYPGMTETRSDRGAKPGFSYVSVFADQVYIRRYWFEAEGA